jgi:hypothetical protein
MLIMDRNEAEPRIRKVTFPGAINNQRTDLIGNSRPHRKFRKVPLRKASSVEERWPRPPRGKASRRHWRSLPKGLKVRIVRFATRRRGFRDRHVIEVTTLLDRKRLPDDAIAEPYAQRWLVELHFRQIKSSLTLDEMRRLSPAIIERELWMHAIAYNLVRALMLEAALTHETVVVRLSFKSAIDALAAWTGPALRCRSRRSRARRELLRRIANDTVPQRPARTEPRMRKRRPKNYQLMTKPLHRMRVSASRSPKWHLPPFTRALS